MNSFTSVVTNGLVLKSMPLILAVVLSGCGMNDYEQGKRHFENERWNKAGESFQKALENGVEDPSEKASAYYYLAEANSKIGKHGESWRSYEKFLQLALPEAPSLEVEIKDRIRLEKIEEAMDIGVSGDVKKASELLAEAEPDKHTLMVAELAVRRGDLEIAKAKFNDAFIVRGKDPDTSYIAELHVARAKFFRELWKRDRDKSDYFRIFRELRLARALTHPDPAFHFYVELLYADLKKQPEFETYAAIDDAYNVMHREERDKNYDKAIAASREIIRLSPLYDDLFYANHKIGDFYLKKGQYREALEHYERALKLSEALSDIIVVNLRDRIEKVIGLVKGKTDVDIESVVDTDGKKAEN